MACIIDKGGVFDCADLKPGGIEQFLIVYNLDDWRAATKTLDVTDGFITDITNAASLQGYRFDVADETNIVPSVAIRAIEGNADRYDHSTQFAVFEQDQATRNNISKLRFAPIVAIVYRNGGTGLVYGSEIGMRLEELIEAPQDPNTGGIMQVTVKTKDTAPGEPSLPIVIDAGDATSTKTLIEGLTTPGA